MSVEQIISAYGYYAVFIFACIEGEVALLIAGFLAHQGVLSLHLVILYAFLGTFFMEQILFQVGRVYGLRIIERFPKIKSKISIVFKWLKRYDNLFIFSFRFIYGIRNISPLIIGTSGISSKRFFFLNLFAAILWSTTVSGVGYVFANAIEGLVAHAGEYQRLFLLCALGFLILLYLVIHLRKRYD